MARIEITREHRLGIERARAEVEKIADALARDLQASCAWRGDELHFDRPGASGHIALDGERLAIRIRLGLLLSPLKGTIEEKIRARLDEALGPETPTA